MLALTLLPGCRHAVGSPLPEAMHQETFCVEQHERDARRLAVDIAESLSDAGLSARSASPGRCRDSEDRYIAYLDNWSWDFRTFMSRITIEVIESETAEILAYGEASQDSFGSLGTHPRDVIDRAVAALLENSNPGTPRRE